MTVRQFASICCIATLRTYQSAKMRVALHIPYSSLAGVHQYHDIQVMIAIISFMSWIDMIMLLLITAVAVII